MDGDLPLVLVGQHLAPEVDRGGPRLLGQSVMAFSSGAMGCQADWPGRGRAAARIRTPLKPSRRAIVTEAWGPPERYFFRRTLWRWSASMAGRSERPRRAATPRASVEQPVLSL